MRKIKRYTEEAYLKIKGFENKRKISTPKRTVADEDGSCDDERDVLFMVIEEECDNENYEDEASTEVYFE